jgi:Transposase DDE domain
MRASSRGNKNGPAGWWNTQLSLFDRDVIAHAETDLSVLCANPVAESKRHELEAQRKTYPQNWPAYNLAQTTEKARFLELLFELCGNVEDMPRKPGAGRSRLPLGEMIFCVVFKTYSTVSGRRFISDLQEARRRGFISKTPHFNSIFNYLELEEMTDCLHRLIIESSLPLKAVESQFAVDSSGFRTKGHTTWFNTKYGTEVDKSVWLKAHVMCGTLTNIITAVEVTDRKPHDSRYFMPLVDRTEKSGFEMKEISADKGYDSFNLRRFTLVKGAIPYIPFRSFSQPKNKGELWKRMYHLYSYQRDEFNAHYHRRSNVESVFSMMKAKFGEKLRSKTEVAQANELLCKVLAHNLCVVIQSMYELGVEANFCAEIPPAQELTP